MIGLVRARQNLDRLRVVLAQAGSQCVDLKPTPLGVGLGLARSETEFTEVSVMGGGNEDQASITCGVYRDVGPDKLTVLDACNSRTRDNPMYPVFLHDAETGWDILVQQTISLTLLLSSPGLLPGLARNLPIMTNRIRAELASLGVVGAPYRWPQDADRLLLRSML